MKPVVGIDIRMMRHSGIGTYLRGVMGPLLAKPHAGFDVALFGNPELALQTAGNIARRPFHAKIYTVQEQLEYPLRLRHCRLWHAPHYNVPLLKGTNKLVVTVHDLIHWIFRKDYFSKMQACYAGTMLRAAVRLADHVITVSEKTKSDLVSFFKADAAKITVIYEGVDPRFAAYHNPEKCRATLQKYGITKPYFLYVGLLKPHKRVDWLLRIFRQMRQAHQLDMDLVIVGKKDARYSESCASLAALQTGGGVFYLPFVEEEELFALYRSAHALVHPSRYEGFGLTLLEAMASATPVIACRVASIPEVAGQAAYLIDPDSDAELEKALQRMSQDENLRQELIAKGKIQAARFRWEDAAAKTAAVYERVLKDT